MHLKSEPYLTSSIGLICNLLTNKRQAIAKIRNGDDM